MRVGSTATPTDLDDLLNRIVTRRRQADDPDLERMPDDPWGVLHYIRRHRRNLSRMLAAAELCDALALLTVLRMESDELELALLTAAQQARLPLSRLAHSLGLRTRQAVEARRLRLSNARDGGQRDEKAARRRKANERARTSWQHTHTEQIRLIAAQLLQHRAELLVSDDLTEWLDDLQEGLDELAHTAAVPAAFVAKLWLTVEIIDESGAAVALATDSTLRAVLDRARALKADHRLSAPSS